MTINRQLLLYGAAPNDADGDFASVASLLDVLATPISYCDRDHRYLYVNDALASRFRLDRSRIVGRTYAELQGLAAFEARRTTLERVLRGEQVSEEREIDGVASGLCWWHLDYYPNRNRNGEVVGYYVFGNEVTAAKQLERAVGERGEQVRRLVESIVLPMARWDRSARMVFCNSPYERWIDRTRGDILGKSLTELFGQAAWTVSKASFEKAFSGKSATYERQVHRRAYGARWHRIHVFPDEIGTDTPETVFTIAFDIDDDIRLRQQLAANEARFRSMLESIDLPIARVDPQFKIAYCNRQFSTYADKPLDAMVGRTIAEVFGEAVFANAHPYYERAFAGEVVTFDRFATHGDLSRWVRVRVAPDRDATGIARAVLVTVYDIDADVRARQQLEEAQRRLDIFTDNIPFPLTYLDREAKYRFANREFLSRHRLLSEQVIGKHPTEARGEKVWEEYKSYFLTALAGETVAYERPVLLGDGTVRWTRTVYAPGRDAEGNIAGVYTSSVDIDELKAAQNEIARVHGQLRAHLASSPVAVVEYDATGLIVQWSRRTEELLGISAAEMIGQRLSHELIHPDDREEIDRVVDRILNGDSPTVVNTHRYRHKAGHYIWMEWYTTIMRGGDGKIQSILSLGIDMQERMEGRLRLQRLADRIPNPITYIGTDSRYQFLNAAFTAWTGITAAQMTGRTVTEVRGATLGGVFQSLIDRALAGEEGSIERVATLASGESRWVKTVFTPDFNHQGKIVGCYNVSFDIHETKLLQQSLQDVADRDPLTHVLTRRAFFASLERKLALADSAVVSLFFADLDGFKAINDRLGHAAGDRVLIETVATLSQCLEASDFMGRLGGDEFVVVTSANTQAAAQAFAQKMIEAVAAVWIIDAPDLKLSVSVGIAMTISRPGAPSSDELVRRADHAMYAAKRDGGGRLRFEQ
jgi:diguanylate cyclase (GGDEF)-like protein/PAS domain S-box-containing protein